MKKRGWLSLFLAALLVASLAPLAATAAAAAEGGGRRVDASTGATPNYRTFPERDLKGMPEAGGRYSILKNKEPYTYYEQEWYGLKLSYLLDVEVGLKQGTTGIKVVGADGYAVTLSPDEMRDANVQGLSALLGWRKGAVNKTGGPYTELDEAEGPFRLVVPQAPKAGPHPSGSPNWNKCVGQVRAIEVIPTPPGLLSVDPATVPAGQILVYGNVLNRRSFTVDQLKSIRRYTGKYRWLKSGNSGTPTCTGIPLAHLVDEVAGTLPSADGLEVVAVDHKSESFTLEEVRATPGGLPFLLAWNVDGELKQEPREGPLMTVRPQRDPADSNRQFWTRNVRVLKVKPLAAADAPDPALVPPDRVIVCGMSDPRNVPNFWYLAEGYTGGGFEEFLCIGNPNSWVTKVIITYMIEGQENQEQRFEVAARSRATVKVNDVIGPDKNVSVSVEGYHGDSVIAERAMYWNGRGGGHCAAGVSRPSTDWYLAEGCTANGFETWVLLQNPGEAEATATVTYMNARGPVEGPTVNLPPKSRRTINVADTLPDDVQVSTRVASDRPIIAERAMYWEGRRAGTCATGLPRTGTGWYLAEGCTAGGFETWLLVQNPGDEAANVKVTYMDAAGPKEGPALDLPARSRATVNVADALPENWQVSAAISSDRPVVAERAVYWGGRLGGHAETAVDAPKFRSLLAEGSTAGGFETWLLVQNPGPSDATVYVTYLTSNGAKQRAPLALPAGTRVTLNEADDVGADWQVSADVNASAPVVVERAIYWAGRAADGSCSHGFPTW